MRQAACLNVDAAYLVHGDDLTVGLLDLAELAKEVPEP